MRTLLALHLIAALSLVAATIVLVPTASAGCNEGSCVAYCSVAGTCVIAGSEGSCGGATTAGNYAAISHVDYTGLTPSGAVGAYAFTYCEAWPSDGHGIGGIVYYCNEWNCDHVTWGWAHIDGYGCVSRVVIDVVDVVAFLDLPLCYVDSPPRVPTGLP